MCGGGGGGARTASVMSTALCWNYQSDREVHIMLVLYSRNGTPHCTRQNFVTDNKFVFVLEQQTIVICWKALRLCLAVSKMTCEGAHEFHATCKNCADVYVTLHLVTQ